MSSEQAVIRLVLATSAVKKLLIFDISFNPLIMKRVLAIIYIFLSVSAISQEGHPLETILQQGHNKYVTSADFHPSGKYAVTGGFDNAIILWNLETGKEIRSYNRHTAAVWSVVFSPDGKQLLSTSADQTAKLYDVLTGDLIRSWDIPKDDVRQAYFSLGGEEVVLISNRDGYFVYDKRSGDEVGKWLKDYSAFYQRNLLDPTGLKALNRGNYKGAQVMSTQNGDTLLNIPFDKVHGMEFSPDGSKIALSSTKLFAKVFDAQTGKELAHLEDKDSDEKCDGCNTKLVWSNSGDFVITMSNRIDAILWNASNGKKIRVFKDVSELNRRPTMMQFAPDDEHVVFNVYGTLFAFNVKSGKKTLELKSAQLDYYDLNVSPDGNYVIIPGKSNTAEVWNIRTGKKKITLKGYLNHEKDDGLKYSYDNWTDTGILKYISMRRGFVLSPDGKNAVIGSVDSIAMMVDLETGKVKQTFQGHSQVVLAFDFSPDGKVLATSGGDRHIKLWDVASGKEIDDIGYHRNLVFDLDFNSDGSKLVSASWDGTMAVWDLKEECYEFKETPGGNSPYCIGFSPNDLYIVGGNLKNNFNFFEADALESFRDLVGNEDIVGEFAYSPDAKQIVTASWDGRVKVWDVLSGMLLARLADHEGAVYSVDWHPTQGYIASGGADNTILLWDPVTSKVLARLEGHTNAVSCLRFVNDGSKLVSLSVDGVMKVWDMDKQTEDYTRIQISRDEWLGTTSKGYFDGSSKALSLVNYVSGMEVVPVSSLFDKYFSPGLIKRVNQGEQFDDRSEHINKLIQESPTIAFHLSESNTRSLPVDVDSVYRWKKEVLPLGIQINSQGQELEEIRIYNNNKLIIAESLEEKIVFRGGDKDIRHYEVPLNNGDNNITGYVINRDRTESPATNILVEFDGEAAKTDLYLLTIGINDYKNPKYDLDYAVNDAKSFGKAISKGADTLFNEIFTFNITNELATKQVIEETIAQIEEKIGPEDVFVFYYAGHGVMSYAKDPADADFYIVTHDVTNLYGDVAMLNEKAVSASELMQFSMEISAEKQLFILDACHSGGALDAFATRGDGREKALAQLARSTGTFFLTASQDAQYANEVGNLKHGLFTYALLEIIEGNFGDNGDKKVTVNELKSYVEDRVPELSEEHRGTPQYPTSYSFGQDFPIVILK